jgi:transcription initiation factor IIE alpha subunit
MLPPKQKADELFRKISMLMDLKHNEILEVLDFLVETKIISPNIEANERKYWEEVRLESKKIN